MRWVVLAVLLAAGFAGCFQKGETQEAAPLDEDSGSVPDGRDANGTDGQGNQTDPRQNGTPIPPHMQGLSANVTANATNGSAPLAVTFYVNVTSGRGQPVDYTLDFGDGNSTNGTLMPGAGGGQDGTGGNGTGNGTGNSTGGSTGNSTSGGGGGGFGGQHGTHTFQTLSVNHTYNWTGNYSVTLNVTQSNDTASANLTIAVEPQEELVIEDSVTCAPTVVVDGSFGSNEHPFDVSEGQRNLTVTLAYDGGATADLDMTITDPEGTVTKSENAGPEPPVSFDRPMAGAWKVEILGYSCAVSQDYTLTATFA